MPDSSDRSRPPRVITSAAIWTCIVALCLATAVSLLLYRESVTRHEITAISTGLARLRAEVYDLTAATHGARERVADPALPLGVDAGLVGAATTLSNQTAGIRESLAAELGDEGRDLFISLDAAVAALIEQSTGPAGEDAAAASAALDTGAARVVQHLDQADSQVSKLEAASSVRLRRILLLGVGASVAVMTLGAGMLLWTGRTSGAGGVDTERRRRILERSSAYGIEIIAPDGRPEFYNPALAALIGCPPAELAQRTVIPYIDLDDLPAAIELRGRLQDPATASGPHTQLLRLVTATGRSLVEVTYTALVGEGGMQGVLASYRDVTAQTEADRSLAASEAGYRELLEHSRNAWAALTPDGMVQHGNQSFASLLGYEDRLPDGVYYDDLFPPEIRSRQELLLRDWMEGTAPTYTTETVLLRRDGARISVALQCTRLTRDGHTAEIWIEATDLAPVAAAREATAAAERFQQAMADAFTAHIAILDDRGYILANNEAWRQFDQEHGSRMRGQIGDDYVAACAAALGSNNELAQAATHGLRALLDGRRARFALEYPAHTQDEKRWFALGVTRIPNTLPQRLLVVHEDITDMRLAQEQRDLLRMAEVRSTFIRTMSHELRTPLNSILGFAQMLDEGMSGPLNDRQERQVHDIRQSGQQLLALINDLLDISRIEAGGLRIAIERLAPRDLIVDVLRSFEPAAEKKQLSLELDLGGCPPLVEADGRALRQILNNLLSNAVKFTNHGGIVLRAYSDAGDLVLEVADTGIGIGAEDIGRVFTEFVQLDTGVNREYGGTGLGLPIARRLAELHGGRLLVASAPGRGAVFTARIPMRHAAPPPPEVLAAAAEVRGGDLIDGNVL